MLSKSHLFFAFLWAVLLGQGVLRGDSSASGTTNSGDSTTVEINHPPGTPPLVVVESTALGAISAPEITSVGAEDWKIRVSVDRTLVRGGAHSGGSTILTFGSRPPQLRYNYWSNAGDPLFFSLRLIQSAEWEGHREYVGGTLVLAERVEAARFHLKETTVNQPDRPQWVDGDGNIHVLATGTQINEVSLTGAEAVAKIQEWSDQNKEFVGIKFMEFRQFKPEEYTFVYQPPQVISAGIDLNAWDAAHLFDSNSNFDDTFEPSAFLKNDGPSSRTLQKMQYRLVPTPDTPSTLTWFEVFSPADASQAKVYTPMSFNFQEASPSPSFTIDPLGVDPSDTNKSARSGMNGTYQVVVSQLALAADGNRDGVIKFDETDSTSADKPYRFWLNNDNDVNFKDSKWNDADPERYPPIQADSANQIIDSVRDCEDLTRIWINAAGNVDMAKDPTSDLYLGLKWKNTNGTHPSIRLFRSADPNGGLGHIKDATIGARQASGSTQGLFDLRNCLADADALPNAGATGVVPAFGWTGITQVEPIVRAADFIFRKDALTDIFGNRSTGYLLFEGVQEGKGELMVVIVRRKSDGTWEKVSDGDSSVWLQLDDIRRMYVRVHSEPLASNFPFPWQDVVATFPPPFPYVESVSQDHAITIPESNLGYGAGDTVENLSEFPFVPTPGEQNKCIVFVHGIDMSVPEVHGYSESFFKRLWWEGYRGRLVSFRWSTPLSSDAFTPLADQPNVSIFNSGEYRSWKCGTALRKYVDALGVQLGSTAVIGVVGHSLGNAAVGEALWQGMRPNSYVAMEAAVSLSSYYWSNPTPSEPVPPQNLRLVNAESGHPTPLDAGSGGYYGYLASLQTIAGLNRVTYYNANDFWLATGTTAPDPVLDLITLQVDWVTNQVNHKPDDRYGPGQYTYDPELNWARFSRGTSFNRTVLDPHERMSFVSRSLTSALGASAPPPGFRGVDLGSPSTYNFQRARPDHSGQFQRDIQLMYGNTDGTPWLDENGNPMPLHRRLMNDLGVAP